MRQSRSRKSPRDAAVEHIATGVTSDVIDVTMTAMLPASACAAVSSASIFFAVTAMASNSVATGGHANWPASSAAILANTVAQQLETQLLLFPLHS